ncbi:MAG: REP-associated tyrosine transposase [Armatimonadota bacterium]|jgi:REP element-mobilizing transposase RayT
MSEWPSPEIFPDRRRPHRLPRCEYRKLLQPVFFACCTSHRRPILLQRGLPAALKILLDESARHHGSEIIAATLMPDHLHVIACVVRDGGDVLSFFSEFKRSAALAAARRGLDNLWQRDFWDRHTRNHHDLTRCFTYVLWNAVEERLCDRPEDWPHTTFRGWPSSLVDRTGEGPEGR